MSLNVVVQKRGLGTRSLPVSAVDTCIMSKESAPWRLNYEH